MRINKPTIDKYIKLIVNKVTYNRRVNQLIKPFKVELISNTLTKRVLLNCKLMETLARLRYKKLKDLTLT